MALFALLPTGVLVLGEQPAHAASAEYFVDAGAAAGNAECTSAAKCRTVTQAVTKALADNDSDDDVLISIAAGDYVEATGISLTTLATLRSLTFEGAGAGATKISPGPGLPVVTVQGLQVVDALVISGVTLHGSSGIDAPTGFPGGGGTGILNVTAKLLRVSHTEIRNLTGGTGGAGPTDPQSNQPASDDGPVGGPGTGILSIGHLELSDTVVDTVTGGAGGKGKDDTSGFGGVGGAGGQATGVAVADLAGDTVSGARLSMHNSTVANLTGGVGGAGGAGIVLPSNGGAGGQAVGVAGQDTAATGLIEVVRSTVRAVSGGAGGGQGGLAGGGGDGIGIGAERAVLAVLAATVSDVAGGGAGGQNSPGGDAGGVATDNVALQATPPLATAATQVTSTTVTAIAGGETVPGGGAAGQAFGVQSKNNPLRLEGALLAVPGATGCLSTEPATGAYNVVSDDSCGPLTGNLVIADLANALEPLAANGGITATHRLNPLPSGDARTAVPVSSGRCAEPDQRGLPRPGFGAPNACAAGAFEPPPVPATPVVVQPPGRTTTQGTSGADYIVVGCGTVEAGGGDDVVVYSPALAAQSPCTGSTAPPLRVHGGAGHDQLTGGPGDDLLVGGSGHDTLRGGPGDDTLIGESGNDRIHGGPGTDDIDPGSGTDRIEAD